MHHEEWTAAQETTTVAVDGTDRRVAYLDTGEGPTVVLLHGIPTWSYLWRAVVAELEDAYRLLVPDLLGYGNSAMADTFDRSIRAQEGMLTGLIDALGVEPAAIVGHDIGGGVALRRAANEPDAVERLVLSNATCYDSWPVPFINDLGVPGSVTDMDEEELEETLHYAFAEGVYGDPSDHEAFVEGMKVPWRTSAGRTSLERCAVATNTNHTTEIDYERITAETLLLWGADDVLQSIDYAERLAEDIAGPAEVVGLNRAYHWVVEDRPAAYADHLATFLP